MYRRPPYYGTESIRRQRLPASAKKGPHSSKDFAGIPRTGEWAPAMKHEIHVSVFLCRCHEGNRPVQLAKSKQAKKTPQKKGLKGSTNRPAVIRARGKFVCGPLPPQSRSCANSRQALRFSGYLSQRHGPCIYSSLEFRALHAGAKRTTLPPPYHLSEAQVRSPVSIQTLRATHKSTGPPPPPPLSKIAPSSGFTC
jgi:hypothetical protein